MYVLAYFLPGFHEDSFNNKWWGKGFTEWENVKNSKPLHAEHFQPNKPLSGYYDLTEQGRLENSYSLARENGIDSFVLYDYWYQGERPLSRVADMILKNHKLDFSYSLCWANHSWTRSWKNRTGALDVLIDQKYGSGEELDVQINHYLKSFRDERYFRINNRPLFQIYKPTDIPNLSEFSNKLREASVKEGLGNPFLVGHYNGYSNPKTVLKFMDALVVSNPTTALFCNEVVIHNGGSDKRTENIFKNVRHLPDSIKKLLYIVHDLLPDKPEYFDYENVVNKMLFQSKGLYKHFGDKIFFSSFCGFDNTPRYKKRAKITTNVSGQTFGYSLKELYKVNPNSELLFINAWNEWGEGMMLEPSDKYGSDLLLSVKHFKSLINS